MTRSLLIVDDEASVTMTLEWFFRNKGYDVFRAFYGDQALQILEQQRPSVMLLDLQMPGVDGIAVLDKLRQKGAGTKVLVVTGYAKQYQQELARLKPEGIKLKPVSMEELTNAVEELFGGAAPVPAAPRAAGGKLRLLFLEGSDQVWLSQLKPFFEADGRAGLYETAHASSPEAAQALLETFRPNLVILDAGRLPIGVDAGRVAAQLSGGEARPSEVIVHALPRQPEAVPAQLLQLEEAVRRAAARYHLLPPGP